MADHNGSSYTNMEKIQISQRIVDQIQQESRRPVCRIYPSHEPFSLFESHLGGVPYLPHDGQIPVDEMGNQLWLCAQINFEQMPHMNLFPERGILQLYLSDYHLDESFGIYEAGATGQKYWRVLYHDVVDETVTEAEVRAKMAVQWEEATRLHMPRPPHQFDKQDIERGVTFLWRIPNVPLKLRFGPVEQEGVNCEDYHFGQLFDKALRQALPSENPKDFEPYRISGDTAEEREALHHLYRQIHNGGCKLGGYARYFQDDPRLYGEGRDAWDILLFQLDEDSDYLPDLDVNDMALALNGGSLNLLIRPEDLIKRDFSQLIADWACT